MTFPLREAGMRPGAAMPPRSRRDEPQRIRVLNWPLLIGTFLFFAIVAPSAYFWHAYQIRRQVHTFLDLATKFEEAGNFYGAEVWLRRYLQIKPGDVEVAVRLADDIQRGSATAQDWIKAVPVLSAILDLHPERDDLRVRMAELQAIANPESGMRTIEALLQRQKDKPDAAALRLRARILDRLAGVQPSPRDLANVTAAYARALEADPANLEVAFRLAMLYRQNSESLASNESVARKSLEDRADALVDDAVAKNPGQPEAFVGRFRYRSKYPSGKTRGADERLSPDLREALKLAPNWGEARLLAAADVLQIALKESFQDPSNQSLEAPITPRKQVDKDRLAEAASHASIAIAADPKEVNAYLLLAQIQLLREQRDKAIQTMQEAIRQANPEHPILTTRLAGALIEDEQWKAAEETLNRLQGIAQKIRSQLQRPSEADRLQAAGEILRAQWFSGESNPDRNLVRAAAALEEAAKLSLGTKLSATANYQLGSVYASLSQWDLAVAAFKRAGVSNPDSILPILGAANAYLKAGQFQSAIDEFHRAQRIVAKAGGPEDPALLIDLARAELGKQSRLPIEKQEWTGFKDALAKVREIAPENIMPMALEIQEALQRDPRSGRDKAKSLLDAAEKTFKKSPDYWRTAFETHLLLGDDKKAEESLDQYEGLTKTQHHSLRAKLHMARGSLDEAQRILAKASEARSHPEYQQSLIELAQIARLQGDLPTAIAKYEELAKGAPKDARWPWELAQLASLNRDGAALDRWEERLRNIEGPEGFYWRYAQTQRLLLEARQGQKGSIAQAAEAARELVKRRPQWPLARFAEGLAAEAQGGYYEAYNAYHRSFELGDREKTLIRRMIGMQILLNHEDRAWAEIEGLSDDVLSSPELAALSVHLAIQQQKHAKAVELARRATTRFPRTPEFHVLLARALWASPDSKVRAGAESELQTAVAVAPNDVSSWLAMAFFHVGVGGPDAADQGLDAVRRASELLQVSGGLPPARQALVAAKAYELIGDIRSADRYYRKAALDDPKDPLLRSLPSTAYISGDLMDSNASLWTSQIRTAAAPVRRLLGLFLASSGASADQTVGTELLQSEPMLRAISLATRGTLQARSEAIALFEKLPPNAQTRGDRVRLAKLYASAGRTSDAQKAFRAAASKSPSHHQWLTILDFWIDQKNFDEAAGSAAAAEKAFGQDGELLERNVRLAVLRGKRQDAEQAARQFVDRKDDRTPAEPKASNRKQRASVAAQALAKAGADAEAVQLLESFVGSGEPAVIQLMAASKASAAKALDLCAQRIKKEDGSLGSVVLAARTLNLAQASKPDARFEPQFDRWMKKSPPPPTSFTSNLAVLREQQGRFQDAIEVTRQALSRQPGDVVSQNNLAWFLTAYTDQHPQALEAIDLVVKKLGPIDSVLDTKGVVLLGMKQTEAAIRLLETAVDSPSSTGPYWLHLAAAYHAAQRTEDCSRCLAKAKLRGLTALSPHDQKLLAQLSK